MRLRRGGQPLYVREKKVSGYRYWILAGLFAVGCLFYLGRLVSFAFSGEEIQRDTTKKVREVIVAERGEIYDCNGERLVYNEIARHLSLRYTELPDTREKVNEVLLLLLEGLAKNGDSDGLCIALSPFQGEFPAWEYTPDALEEGSATNEALVEILESYKLEIADGAEAFVRKMLKKYKLTDAQGELLYSEAETAGLLRLRYDMERCGFSRYQPYALAQDISEGTLLFLRERNLPGCRVETTSTRAYAYPGYASHILGSMGSITAATKDYYLSLGYGLDEKVGVSGCEKAFETILRGQDGVLVTVLDEDGSVVDRYYETEPVAGGDIWLTIDIELQMATEQALAANIAYVVSRANGTRTGEDCSAGSTVVLDPDTGAVLAMASYPTYDLTTYNRDYATLAADATSPLTNRALWGQYPPGSTFKLGVALAALENEIIQPETLMETKGKYTYYADYQPRCSIYTRLGISHGIIDVVEAIQVSCNYFFYEIGRLMGIDTMNDTMSSLGLGQATGIELGEAGGILAGARYRDAHGLGAWSAGDTLQASIGQSENLFTPIQLATYTATMVNGGTRYKTFLLQSVRTASGEILDATPPTVLQELALGEDNLATVLAGARSVVTESSTLRNHFKNVPVAVAGKTGTAQITKTASDNAVFVGFAPYDDPKIVVANILEHGSSGSNAAYAVARVMEAYFGEG